jgi:hypothetical protein
MSIPYEQRRPSNQSLFSRKKRGVVVVDHRSSKKVGTLIKAQSIFCGFEKQETA